MRGLFEREGHKRNGAGIMRAQRPSFHLGITLMAAIALILAFALAVPATVNAATSGPNSPTLAVNNASIGTNAWATPANALTSDNAYATASALSNLKVTNYLVATGFNFAIPVGATINGIEVSIERREGGKGSNVVIRDNSVKLVKAGVIGGNDKADTVTTWPATDGTAVYGSSADLWGNTFTEAEINASNFGVAISAKSFATGGFGSEDANIDAVSITVYYTVAGGCTTAGPTVTITEANQTISLDNGSVTYNVTIGNGDTGTGCTSPLPITLSTSAAAAGFTVSASTCTGVANVVSGGSTTCSFTVAETTATSGNTTGTTVTAAAASHTSGTASRTTTYTPAPTCTTAGPTVTITEANQTISLDNGSVTYNVTIGNGDTGTGCTSPLPITLSTSAAAAGFTVSASTCTGIVNVVSGGSTTCSFTVAETTATSGNTTGTTVTAAAAGHTDGTATRTTTYNTGGASVAGNSPTLAANNTSIGTNAWVTPANALTSNNVYATASALSNLKVTNYLLATGFNFAIPVGATINGIEVSIERREGSKGSNVVIRDNSVKLVKAGVIGGNDKADTVTAWPATDGTAVYGSNADLWGNILTATDINASNFGVAISAKSFATGGFGNEDANIDAVTITVYYNGAPPVCTPTAPTVSIAPTSGSITTNGGTANYTVSITNNDTGPCSNTTFNLPVTNTNNTDFTVVSSLAPVLLAPGASTTVPLAVTAVSGKTTGTTNTSVSATEAGHTTGNSNIVATTISVPVCTKPPTVSISFLNNTITTNGGGVTYSVYIRNNDDAGCPNVTFNLPVTNTNNTDFTVAANLTPATLAAGANTTVPLLITAVAGKTTGSTDTYVTATHATHPNGPSNTGTTTINVCATAAPTLALSPASGTITTDGGYADYTLTVTNNDGVLCPNSTFILTPADSNAIQFVKPSVLTLGSVVLAPGASTSTNLRVTAKAGSISGTNNTYVTSMRGMSVEASSNTVATTINVAVCTRTAPTVSLTPSAKTIATNGGTAEYALTITNNDNAACANETFNLTKSDSNGTNFSNSTLSSLSVILAPGASSSGLTLTVNATAGQTSGTNTSSVTAASINHADKTSNNVITTLSISTCTLNIPILIITPNAQTVTPGGTAAYTVKVKNTDTAACTASTFAVNIVGDSNLTNFNASTRTPVSLTLAPGATGTSDVTVYSKVGAPISSVNITTIGVSATGHTSPANVTGTTTVAPISPLMHNSINVGTCSNSTYTNQTDCVANSAVWTASTKWAPNGWGIPGGHYGEFKCATCHSPETTNIKGVKETITSPNAPTHQFPVVATGGAVVFQSLSQMGDDRTGGHANSNRVCQVCHTYDAGQAVGVKQHAYNMPSDPGHFNGVDCMTCHKHQSGFKPSNCTACHGAPPTVDTVGGPNGLTLDSGKVTGSTTAGKHSTHAVTLGYSCTFCHNNYEGNMRVASTVPGMENQWDITIGFNALGRTTGSYTGQIGVSYNQTAGTGGLTCSTIYCHSSGQSSDGLSATPVYSTPAWNGTAACGSCHATTAPNFATGSHTKHLAANTNCGNCHTGATASTYPFGVNHVNGSIDVGLGTYTMGGTPGNGYGTCSTASCHDNGKGVAVVTPTWGTTVAACTACHALIPGNSHNKHVTGLTPGFNRNALCADCHTGYVQGLTAAANHLNGTIEVNTGGYPSPKTKGSPFASCTTSYCHSNGAGVVKAPTWGGTNSAGCNFCHDAAPTTGTHSLHIAGGANYSFACTECHGHIGTGSTHGDNSITIVAGIGYNGSKQCTTSDCHSDGKAITPAYAASPAWGGSFAGDRCAGCHGNWPNSNAHGAHVVGIHYDDIYNNTTGKIAAAAGAGTNAGHGNPLYSTTVSCNICHFDTVTVNYNDSGSVCSTASCHGTGGTAKGQLTTASLSKTFHVNRSRDVKFASVTIASKSQIRDSITSVAELNNNWLRNNGYKAGESSNDSAKTLLNSASYVGGSCSSVACHNGNSVTWTAGAISCDKCHTALP